MVKAPLEGTTLLDRRFQKLLLLDVFMLINISSSQCNKEQLRRCGEIMSEGESEETTGT